MLRLCRSPGPLESVLLDEDMHHSSLSTFNNQLQSCISLTNSLSTLDFGLDVLLEVVKNKSWSYKYSTTVKNEHHKNLCWLQQVLQHFLQANALKEKH